MRLSTDATVVLSVGTVGVLLLVPRTHLIDDLSRQMEMAHSSHPIITEYDSTRLSASKLAKRLKNMVASPAIPLLVVSPAKIAYSS